MTDDATPDRSYRPEPIDTSGVTLPRELMPLLERLAENAHDLWARQRLADGWRWGPARDDPGRRHPGLVPYDRLSEGERTYDRVLAAETLRAVLALGWRIVPPPADGDRSTERPAGGRSAAFDARTTLAAITRADARVTPLVDLWNTHADDDWAQHPELFAVLARRLVQLGEPLLARDVLRVACMLRPGDPALRHLDALALARSGATLEARDAAERLAAEIEAAPSGVSDTVREDVLALVGRTAKDLALDADDPAEREAQLGRALAAYERAYALRRGTYPGINAATLALLAGDAERAAVLARAVRDALRAVGERSFWELATLGEAALLLGARDEARDWYARAAIASAGVAPADVASTRRQARLILTHGGEPATWIDEVLATPAVVVFAGDRFAGAGGRGIAAAQERGVREEIERRLPAEARIGFSSAADGGDILFQEAMDARGAATYVVLPYGAEEFAAANVAPEWATRFAAVCARATECVPATPQRSLTDPLLAGYAHEILLGLAAIHARWIDARLVVLVAVDPRHGAPLGGAAAALERWRRAGHDVQVIDIAALGASRAEVA